MLLDVCFIALLTAITAAAAVADPGSKNEIINLPGLNFDINFKHYSGYLRVSKTKFLHYWFVESQNDPTNDPLIFWFNGGPGCSSILGLLGEMGPYLVSPEGTTLRENPNEWNKFASVVYIESPAGVGYSYASDGNTTTNDALTANYNYNAVKQFLTIHSSFRNHSTFIIGESYAGVYIPTLAAKVIDGQSKFPINFEGIGIGNGLVNWDINTKTQMQYAYNHGLIDEEEWIDFEELCCHGCFDTCKIQGLTGDCKNMSDALLDLFGSAHLNPYDIYQTCSSSSLLYVIRMKLFYSQSLSKETELKFKHLSFSEIENSDCSSEGDIGTYMNLPEVRKALHINEKLGKWYECSGGGTYKWSGRDMSPYFKKIVASNVRVLLYYGDTDMMCNFLGGQKFTDQLGYQLLKPKYAFEVNGQVGGFATVYDKNVTFVTIRGAGHMAPEWKAPETKYVIENFIKNQVI